MKDYQQKLPRDTLVKNLWFYKGMIGIKNLLSNRRKYWFTR